MNKQYQQNHKQFKSILVKAAVLRWKKMNDYGLSYKEFGSYGILVRLSDKFERLKKCYINKKTNFESLEDTLVDIINYSTMMIMELEGKCK